MIENSEEYAKALEDSNYLITDFENFQEKQRQHLRLWGDSKDALRALTGLTGIVNDYLLKNNEWYTEQMQRHSVLSTKAVTLYTTQKTLLNDVVEGLQTAEGTLDLLKQTNSSKDIHRLCQELVILSTPIDSTLTDCSKQISKLVAEQGA